MDRQDEYDTLEALQCFEWIKLPCECMKECGPAAQTFGAVLRNTRSESFRKTEKFADTAGLPLRTVKRHLTTLEEFGWLENQGRQRMPSGRPRRTATRRITTKAKDRASEFGVLPEWWTAIQPELTWSERAVYSVVLARVLSVASGGKDMRLSHVSKAQSRFQFSLRMLEKATGLQRYTIAKSKASLVQRSVLRSYAMEGNQPDVLFPSGLIVYRTASGFALKNFWTQAPLGAP